MWCSTSRPRVFRALAGEMRGWTLPSTEERRRRAGSVAPPSLAWCVPPRSHHSAGNEAVAIASAARVLFCHWKRSQTYSRPPLSFGVLPWACALPASTRRCAKRERFVEAACPQASLSEGPSVVWMILRPSRRMLREACRSRSSVWSQAGQTKMRSASRRISSPARCDSSRSTSEASCGPPHEASVPWTSFAPGPSAVVTVRNFVVQRESLLISAKPYCHSTKSLR